jgi:hypothetical protein
MRLKPTGTLRVWHLYAVIVFGFHLQTVLLVSLVNIGIQKRTDAESSPPERR